MLGGLIMKGWIGSVFGGGMMQDVMGGSGENRSTKISVLAS